MNMENSDIMNSNNEQSEFKNLSYEQLPNKFEQYNLRSSLNMSKENFNQNNENIDHNFGLKRNEVIIFKDEKSSAPNNIL